jgi:hypothetical protein
MRDDSGRKCTEFGGGFNKKEEGQPLIINRVFELIKLKLVYIDLELPKMCPASLARLAMGVVLA